MPDVLQGLVSHLDDEFQELAETKDEGLPRPSQND